MNEPINNLAEVQCPECNQQETILIRVESNTAMDDEGTDFYHHFVKSNDVEWHAGSQCRCPACGFSGKVFQFRKETLLDVMAEVDAISLDGHFIRQFALDSDTMQELDGAEGDDLTDAKNGIALHLEVIGDNYQKLEWFITAIQLEMAEYENGKGWTIYNIEFNKAANSWVKKDPLHILTTYKLTVI